jgi:hypothetical protein
LVEEAANFELQKVKEHEWRFRELKKRMSSESIERTTKICEILNGLTANEK